MSINMNKAKTDFALAVFAAVVAAAVAVVAHGRWPYHYYETFRWIICCAALYCGYLLRTRPLALTACVAIGIVFNPIAPLRMRASQWQQYDIVAALVMATVAIYAWQLWNATKHSAPPAP